MTSPYTEFLPFNSHVNIVRPHSTCLHIHDVRFE